MKCTNCFSIQNGLWAGGRQGGAGVAWNVGGGVSDHGGGRQYVYVVGPLGR